VAQAKKKKHKKPKTIISYLCLQQACTSLATPIFLLQFIKPVLICRLPFLTKPQQLLVSFASLLGKTKLREERKWYGN